MRHGVAPQVSRLAAVASLSLCQPRGPGSPAASAPRGQIWMQHDEDYTMTFSCVPIVSPFPPYLVSSRSTWTQDRTHVPSSRFTLVSGLLQTPFPPVRRIQCFAPIFTLRGRGSAMERGRGRVKTGGGGWGSPRLTATAGWWRGGSLACGSLLMIVSLASESLTNKANSNRVLQHAKCRLEGRRFGPVVCCFCLT